MTIVNYTGQREAFLHACATLFDSWDKAGYGVEMRECDKSEDVRDYFGVLVGRRWMSTHYEFHMIHKPPADTPRFVDEVERPDVVAARHP